jgi:hypothetical protein
VRAREEDIKATAEDLIDDAEALKRIEQRKLGMEPGDPRLAKLSDEANRIIRRMVPKAEVQKELANGDAA